jgi:CHAD domain-containing protein
MPFHFKKREPVIKAIRRICRERIADALETLKDGGRPHAIHNARREIKKLRAVFRLMRGEIGNKIYRRNNRALRTAAHGLTAMRDAQVKLNVFEDLLKHFRRRLPSQPFPEIGKVLRKHARDKQKRFLKGRSAAAVGKILRELKDQLGDLKSDSKGWAAVSPGLNRSFCRGQEALRGVQRDCSPDNLHEWRKRVKDLWHHLRLLGDPWPKKQQATKNVLEQLGALLGDDHDLQMLAEFVKKKFKRAGDAETLNKLIRLRQKELRSEALTMGKRFYAETPAHFCQRIGNYWKIWRGGKK